MTKHLCKTCVFYAPIPDNGKGDPAGRCKRFPPTYLDGDGWYWPKIKSTDTCGEHSALQGFAVGHRPSGVAGPSYFYRLLPQ